MKKLTSIVVLLMVCLSSFASVPAFNQCGGIGFTGESTCVDGYVCTYVNDYYSQCLPGDGSTAPKTKLKVVSCKCPSTGKTGSTAKCKTDGDKEACTATQQGLNGCYSTSMFSPGTLLCTGV